jgi:HD-like signal output (HDOD) protein
MTSNSSSSPARHATLGRLELRCPPLPQTLLEATHLIDHPEMLEVDAVTEMVQRDPIVVAKLLHIVNSAYYGLRRTISSVERSVVMLGPVAVTGIVVGMNMLRLNSVLEGPASRCFDRLVRHSIATAFLLRHLLEGFPGRRPRFFPGRTSGLGVGFTAGLLHDFGKIILVYNFPEEALELYEKGTLEEEVREPDVRHMEQLLFGCDHTEAGEYVARKLGFPDALIEIVRHHHEPGYSTGDRETDQLIRTTAVANVAAKAMGYALEETLSWEAAQKDPSWGLFIQRDQPKHGSVASLVQELQELQEHLDQYVIAMTTNPEKETKRGLASGNARRL